MAKAKLVIANPNPDRIEVAAAFAKVKNGENMLLGSDLHLEVDFREPQNLVDFGRFLERLTDKEIAAVKKVWAEKAAAKAAKEKEKSGKK